MSTHAHTRTHAHARTHTHSHLHTLTGGYGGVASHAADPTVPQGPHIDTDNYMTIHHKGTSYFDSTAHLMCFVTPLKE